MNHPTPTRCAWVSDDPLYQAYHDQEWGVPVHGEHRLFEFLVLEGAQAGLSWLTVLRKRERYRNVFAGFDPAVVARFSAADQERLLADAGIIRHRGKIAAAVGNAQAFLRVQDDFGSFDAYLWRYVDGTPIRNAWASPRDVPTRTALSDTLAKDLQRRGFKFVGSTICYAYLQAVGVVNDHTTDCLRFRPA